MNTKAKLKKQADKLWKEKILSQSGYQCELCGGNWHLTAHHYYYRSFASHLIHEKLNGVALCAKCHFQLHASRDRKSLENKIVKLRGIKWLNKLDEKLNDRPKSSWKNIKYYQDKITELTRA